MSKVPCEYIVKNAPNPIGGPSIQRVESIVRHEFEPWFVTGAAGNSSQVFHWTDNNPIAAVPPVRHYAEFEITLSGSRRQDYMRANNEFCNYVMALVGAGILMPQQQTGVNTHLVINILNDLTSGAFNAFVPNTYNGNFWDTNTLTPNGFVWHHVFMATNGNMDPMNNRIAKNLTPFVFPGANVAPPLYRRGGVTPPGGGGRVWPNAAQIPNGAYDGSDWTNDFDPNNGGIRPTGNYNNFFNNPAPAGNAILQLVKSTTHDSIIHTGSVWQFKHYNYYNELSNTKINYR